MTTKLQLVLALCALLLAAGCAHNPAASEAMESTQEIGMQVHYLEIVTPDMEQTCSLIEKLQGVEFGDPDPMLGNARTALLYDSSRIGVRAPMHGAEKPVVRPYVLVEDIAAAVQGVQDAGGQLMVPPMPIPGQGKCAVYTLGGIEHGFWELEPATP